MPKLSKNAEIAQFYTFAQQSDANAHLMEGLDGLITSLQDSIDDQEYPTNLEKGLLASLHTFKDYCKYAAEDINSGVKKSPNLIAASEEAKRVFEGINKLKESYPKRYGICEEQFRNFTNNSKVMTAAQWIEQTRKDFNAGSLSMKEAIERIFTIRNLANAERGKRENIDKTILTGGQIGQLQEKYSKSKDFEEFYKRNETELYGMLGKIGSYNHGGKMEDLFKKYALNHNESTLWDDELFGRLKPEAAKQAEFKREAAQKKEQKRVAKAWNATKWIEASQKHIEENFIPELIEDPASKILAARMVADAQIGSTANIDNKKLTGYDFWGVAERLRNSKPFQDYMYEMRENAKSAARKAERERLAALNNRPVDDPAIVKHAKQVAWNVDKTLFTDGHGERFETDFRKYLLARPDVDKLDPELYGKFLKGPLKVEEGAENAPEYKRTPREAADAKYSTIRDYFIQNKTNADGTVSKTYHAAKMAAAFELMSKNPEAIFDRKVLESKARSYLKDPSFRMITRDPRVVLNMAAGDVNKFSREVAKLRNTFEDVGGEFQGYNGGFRDAINELKEAGLPETKNMTDLASQCLTAKDHQIDKKIALANAIIEFQEKYGGEKTGPLADAVNGSMKLLANFVADSSAESYLPEQLDKVNSARGLKPEDKGYLKPDDVIAKAPENPEIVAGQKEIIDHKKGELFI